MNKIISAVFMSWLALQSDPSAAVSDPVAEAKKIREGGPAKIQEFVAELNKNGVQLDLEHRKFSFQAETLDPQMPIEYLVVGGKGAVHESLFVTKIKPSLLTIAIHLMGIQPGSNVQYKDKNPLPKEGELAEGMLPYDVIPPAGDGMYIYAQWKNGEESRRYRIEDLLLNTKRGKTAARVRWVFLGSKMLPGDKKHPSVFAADLEENFVSICFFGGGNQLFTNPDLDGQEQHLFFPNQWLLPEKGSTVTLTFSVDKLD